MLRLRLAEYEKDWARLWSWRCDPETCAQFRETQAPTLKEHLAWLKRTLADDNVWLFIADDQEFGVMVGTARLDVTTRKKEERWAEISITIEPRTRGRGYAASLVAAVMDAADADVVGIIANVKLANHASLRAFVECGFSLAKYSEDTEMATLERKLR